MKKNTKKTLICLGLIAIFSMFLTGCLEKQTTSKKPIKISLNAWPGYGYAYLAQEKGFFKKNNVEVELVLKNSTSDALNLFINNEVDGCFSVFADIVRINSEGIPVKIVSIVDYSTDSDVILGRYNKLVDLQNKTVSFEGVNSFSHAFVVTALENAGLSEANVRLENINAHDVLSALESKKIDAGHTWEPTKTMALKKGYKIIAKAGDFPGIITDVLVFNPTIIQEQYSEIYAVIKSLFEALDYLETNRDESIDIMARMMNMTKEEMVSGLNGIHQPNLKKHQDLLPSLSLLYVSGRKIMKFYNEHGQLFNFFDIKNIVDAKFVYNILKAKK